MCDDFERQEQQQHDTRDSERTDLRAVNRRAVNTKPLLYSMQQHSRRHSRNGVLRVDERAALSVLQLWQIPGILAVPACGLY